MARARLVFRVLGRKTPREHVERFKRVLVESRSGEPWRYPEKLLLPFFDKALPFMIGDERHRVIGLFRSGEPIGVAAVSHFPSERDARAFATVMRRVNARWREQGVKALKTILTPQKIAGLLAKRGFSREALGSVCFLKALALDKRFQGHRLGRLLHDATLQFARGELEKTWAVVSTSKKSRAYSMLSKIGVELDSGLIDGRKQSVFLIDLRKAVRD